MRAPTQVKALDGHAAHDPFTGLNPALQLVAQVEL